MKTFLTILLLALPLHALETRVGLRWDPPLPDDDVTGYRLHLGPSSGTYDTIIDVGFTTSWTLVGLPIGATYFCAVTAYNVYGLESDYSDEISFTVRDPALLPPYDPVMDSVEILFPTPEDPTPWVVFTVKADSRVWPDYFVDRDIVVEVSPDLVSWTRIATRTYVGAPVRVVDWGIGTTPSRFYRVGYTHQTP